MADQAEWGELQQQAGAVEIVDERESKTATEGKSAPESKTENPASTESIQSPPRKAASGWGDSPENSNDPFAPPSEDHSAGEGKSNVERKKRPSRVRANETEEMNKDSEAKPVGRNHGFFDNEADDDTIVIIPDLDEEQEEDLAFTVAEAPKNFRQVQSLNQLNDAIDQIKVPVSESSTRIDLSLLLNVLAPKEKVMEPDEPWEFEQLLEEVSQAMTKEKESNAEFEKQVGVKKTIPATKSISSASKSSRTRAGIIRSAMESKAT